MQYSYVLLKIIKKLVLKKDRKMNIFNKKYLSKNNFKLFKEDFLFIINFLKKKNIKFNNHKILDEGCANGSFLYFLKQKYPNNLYSGLDLDSNLLDLNRKNKSLKDIIFIHGSVKKKIFLSKIII